MATLSVLYIYITTSTQVDADSDSRLSLVYTQADGREHEIRLGGLPHDERQRGRTDYYVAIVESNEEMRDIKPPQFRLVALGGDAWLPDSVFIVGRGGDKYRVLVGRAKWPRSAWLSTDLSDVDGKAAKARLLDRFATPVIA